MGQARAGLVLPGWPAHCRQPVAHAGAELGADAVSTLRRERAQLDFANQRAANCGAWYDRLEAELAAR